MEGGAGPMPESPGLQHQSRAFRLRLRRLSSDLVLACAGCLPVGVVLAAEPVQAPPPVEAAPAAASVRSVAVPVRGQGFDILEIAVDGNTRLSEFEVQTVLEPFVGEQRKASDVDAARVALEQLYKSRGYKTVSVSIPKQTIRDGLVILQVTEGRIASLEVQNAKYSSLDQIKSEVPSLAEGQIPDFKEVEQELAYANRLPNRRVTPSLSPGKEPGSVDIDLKVEDKLPLRLSAEINNRHGRDTTANRVIATAGYDNLFQLGHSLTLSFQTAPERTDDGSVYLAVYRAPLGDASWNLSVVGLRTSSNVSALGGVDVLGSGRSLGVELSKQLGVVGGKLYPSVSAGIDYKRFNTAARVGPGAEVKTPAEYFPFSLSYSQLLRLERQSLRNELSINFASPQLGSDGAELDLNRFRARGQMFYARSSFDYSLELPADLELGWRASGQISDQPLISSEQFASGGSDSVRGYLEAEALGDQGYNTSVELRGPSVPEYFTGTFASRVLTEFRPLLFMDAGNVRQRGPFADNSSRRSSFLSSYGAGVSVQLVDHINGSLFWAMPLHDGPATPKHDNRLLFRFSASL